MPAMARITTARLLSNPNTERERDELRAFAHTCGRLILRAAALLLATSLLVDPSIVCEDCFWVPLGFGAAFGVALTIAGMGESPCAPGPCPVPRAARRTQPPEVRRVPRLGEVLVCHFGWLRAHDFDLALSHRREHGGLIGQVLVETRLITQAQLDKALEAQDRYRRLHGVEPWQACTRTSP